MSSKKINVGIYLIDRSRLIEADFGETVSEIIEIANKKEEKFYQEPVLQQYLEGFDFQVFRQLREYEPKWKGFVDNILADGAALTSARNTSHSFLMFIYHGGKIFVIAGGSSVSAIRPFIDEAFGFDILSRLIEKDSRVVQQIRERGVTGVVIGQSRYYRGDQRLADENSFGKIFKEVKAQLNRSILTTIFGFKAIEIPRKSAACLAKNSFQINKLIDFTACLRIIKRLNLVLDEYEPKFSINDVELINNKGESAKLINSLRDVLIENLYQDYLNEREPNIDLCHKDFELYFGANLFEVVDPGESKEFIFEEAPTLGQIFADFRRKKGEMITNQNEFKHFILLAPLKATDEDGKQLTTDKIKDHIHGEVSYLGQSYFIVDGNWYRIKPAFVDQLNTKCKQLLKHAWDDKIITTPFKHANEGEFNQSPQKILKCATYCFKAKETFVWCM